MAVHPIESLMRTTMESLKSMVDVNTVVGEPVETKDGTVIVPVSRVSFGFVAGGGDDAVEGGGQGGGQESEEQGQGAAGGGSLGSAMPFTGGSGAGVSVKPVGFLVVGLRKVRFIPVDSQAIYDRLLDEAPELLDRVAAAIGGSEGIKDLAECAKERVKDKAGERNGRDYYGRRSEVGRRGDDEESGQNEPRH